MKHVNLGAIIVWFNLLQMGHGGWDSVNLKELEYYINMDQSNSYMAWVWL